MKTSHEKFSALHLKSGVILAQVIHDCRTIIKPQRHEATKSKFQSRVLLFSTIGLVVQATLEKLWRIRHGKLSDVFPHLRVAVPLLGPSQFLLFSPDTGKGAGFAVAGEVVRFM